MRRCWPHLYPAATAVQRKKRESRLAPSDDGVANDLPELSGVRIELVVVAARAWTQGIGWSARIEGEMRGTASISSLIRLALGSQGSVCPTLLEALDGVKEPVKPPGTIRFKSRDCDGGGRVFGLDTRVAMAVAPDSEVFRGVIRDNGAGGRVPVVDVESYVLEKVVEYTVRHAEFPEYTFEHGKDGTFPYPEELQIWDEEFFDVGTNMLYHILMAARYLNIRGLLFRTIKAVADIMKDKTADEIRKTFNIKNDFTPEEQEQMQREELLMEDQQEYTWVDKRVRIYPRDSK